MTQRIPVTAIWVTALGVVAACGQDQGAHNTASTHAGELAGEVFIVTQGGPSIKLGLVSVSAIAENDIQTFIENKKLAAETFSQAQESIIAAAQRAVDDAQGALLDAQEARPKSSERDAQYLACLQTNATRGECRFQAQKRHYLELEALKAQVDASRAELKSRLDALAALTTAVEETRGSDYYFKDLPAGFAVAKTNADGLFSMTVPTKGRFAIAAKAERQVFGEPEKYHWLVWISPNGQATTRVMLSNDNMTTAGSPDSVIQLSSE